MTLFIVKIPFRSLRFLSVGWIIPLGIAILFPGCTPSPQESSEEGSVRIVFKHGKLAGDPETFQGLLRRFEAEHPGIRVQDEILPASTDQQHQFYVISLEGRSTEFDVLAMDVIWVQEFARANWIKNLSHLLPPPDRTGFFPGPMKAVTYRGEVYAVPWYIDAGLLYYRKDLIEKYGLDPPKTWGALVETSRSILEKEKDPRLRGFVWQGKQYEGLICNILEYIWSAGGRVLNEDGEAVLSSPEARKALDFSRSLIGPHGVSPPMVTTADEEATRRIFGEGRAVFMRNWPYAWNLFQSEGSPVRGKVGISVLPSFRGHPSAATLGGWQLGVNRYTAYPEEAEALIRFLTSPEIQRWMAVEIGYKPSLKFLYQDETLKRAQPFIAGLYDVFLTARPRPVSPYYLMLSQVMQPEFSAALVGLRDSGTALKNAQRQMNHILSGQGKGDENL